jgi:predicted RNA methylase
MNAFRVGILNVCEGKIVLDVGTGTGVLAIQAVRAGARQVYAIEASDMFKTAKNNCGLIDEHFKISLYNERVEEVELEPSNTKVDVIISE